MHRQLVDVDRIAELFGGSYQAAYALARDTWLPETVVTLRRLQAAILMQCGDLFFLCNHLREGARLVGATGYLDLADAIAFACAGGKWGTALRFIDDGVKRSDELAQWLSDRCDRTLQREDGLVRTE